MRRWLSSTKDKSEIRNPKSEINESTALAARTFAEVARHSRYAGSDRGRCGDRHFLWLHAGVRVEDAFGDFFCVADGKQHHRGGAGDDVARPVAAVHAGDLSLGV